MSGFGVGNSESKQSNSTTSIDGRVVGGEYSTNVSLSGNSGAVSVVTTDAGAVNGALKLALAGVEGANHTTELALNNSGDLLSDALKTVANQQQGFTSAIEQIKTGDKSLGILVGGVAVIALAAVLILKKKA